LVFFFFHFLHFIGTNSLILLSFQVILVHIRKRIMKNCIVKALFMYRQ
jgi:hypothetical protein